MLSSPTGKPPKQFGLPTSYPLSREDAVKLRFYARSWSQAHRQPGQHGPGPITRAAHDVLNAIIGFANQKTGSCFPSMAAIAKRAACAVSTVERAVDILETAGVLRRVNRLTRRGGKLLRTSNAYVFRAVGANTENPRGTYDSKESGISMTAQAAVIAEPLKKYLILDPARPVVVLDPRVPTEMPMIRMLRDGLFPGALLTI